MRRPSVNLGYPVNLDHPLNQNGLQAWWKPLRGGVHFGGPVVKNILAVSQGRSQYDATLTGSPLPKWMGSFGDNVPAALFLNGGVVGGPILDPNSQVNCADTDSIVMVANFIPRNSSDSGQLMLRGEDGFGSGWNMVLSFGGTNVAYDVVTGGQITINGTRNVKYGELNQAVFQWIPNSTNFGWLNGQADGTASTNLNFNLRSSTKGIRMGDVLAVGQTTALCIIESGRIYKGSYFANAERVAELYEEDLRGNPNTLNWLSNKTWSFAVTSVPNTANVWLLKA